MYQIVRLDYWDYRHPTGRTFDDEDEAIKEAERLTKLEMDPLSCYIVSKA